MRRCNKALNNKKIYMTAHTHLNLKVTKTWPNTKRHRIKSQLSSGNYNCNRNRCETWTPNNSSGEKNNFQHRNEMFLLSRHQCQPRVSETRLKANKLSRTRTMNSDPKSNSSNDMKPRSIRGLESVSVTKTNPDPKFRSEIDLNLEPRPKSSERQQ